MQFLAETLVLNLHVSATDHRATVNKNKQRRESMCDIDAYVLKNGKEEKIMENVDRVEQIGEEMRLANIFGEIKSLKASIIFYDNSEKKMVFEPAG